MPTHFFMNLCDLPDEMLEEVLGLLPARDQASAKMACGRLRRVYTRAIHFTSWQLAILDAAERKARIVAALRALREARVVTIDCPSALANVARGHPDLVRGLAELRLPVRNSAEYGRVAELMALLPSLRRVDIPTLWSSHEMCALLQDPRVAIQSAAIIIHEDMSPAKFEREEAFWASVGGRRLAELYVRLTRLTPTAFDRVAALLERARAAGLRADRVRFACEGCSAPAALAQRLAGALDAVCGADLEIDVDDDALIVVSPSLKRLRLWYDGRHPLLEALERRVVAPLDVLFVRGPFAEASTRESEALASLLADRVAHLVVLDTGPVLGLTHANLRVLSRASAVRSVSLRRILCEDAADLLRCAAAPSLRRVALGLDAIGPGFGGALDALAPLLAALPSLEAVDVFTRDGEGPEAKGAQARFARALRGARVRFEDSRRAAMRPSFFLFDSF